MNENDDEKPDPDRLLDAVRKQENQSELGRLKIFFGMSAGVGKTYAMLQEAHQRQKEGVDVVIGTVNTHGRKETEALLRGLPVLPEKWVKYKESVFSEMDSEAILKAKPQLVLIDELAHTNVPGAKHLKRWQDVIEILDAGIDVYSTLNVQHVESRKDIVESLTGIVIRETVPDIVLDRASSIELMDIPAQELLKRLREGKVYLGEQSRTAAENFFSEENLTALREISLRFTAEKVDHDLHGILRGKGWKTRERLMVAMNSSPSSERLIRAARRMAFELDAPWIVVYIDTGEILRESELAGLNRNLNLARELGAEVITSHDSDVADALQRIAEQKDITRIVVGRTSGKKAGIRNLFRTGFTDRLENENKHIDIVILRQEKLTNIFSRSISVNVPKGDAKAYGAVLAFGIGITAIGFFLSPYIGYKSVGFIFLFGILILSFFVGRGPIFLAAFLSAICWDLLFIPPLFTPMISDPQDVILVAVYFFVAAIMGTMTSRMREQGRFLRRREEEIESLYEIERDILAATDFQALRVNIAARLEKRFPGKFDIVVKGPGNGLILDSRLPLLKEEIEKAAVAWVFQTGKIGGRYTDTLPSAEGVYFPIKFSGATVGVLIYHPKKDIALSTDETNFIRTVSGQLGTYVRRRIFEEQVAGQEFTEQIERMHRSVFHSLDRSFFVPLEEIARINRQIREECVEPHLLSLIDQADRLISGLKWTADNIVAISELESGFVRFEPKNHSVDELIDRTLEDVKPFMNGHSVVRDVPSLTSVLPFDFDLLKLALKNLIVNALECTRSSDPISVKLEVFPREFSLSVIDGGIGISAETVSRIFDKFYQVSGESKGPGIGLTIVKEIVDIHRGKIEVADRKEKGTKFSLILPIETEKE